ncbi:putative zinc finger protein 735 [Oppia nitens]|uniref:putative zinc finger protein 735 n=1 Tax=Oppia nitens TaxID=1686743 RepID=UPI0023DA7D36|nr:putative zinc finger protein 735 [Oppia nitens]
MSVTNNDDNMDDDNNISGSSGQTKDPNEIHWTDGYVDVNTTTTNTTADEMDGELVTADNSGGGVDEDETPDDSTERLQLVLPPVRHKSTVDVWIHYMLLGNKCCVCKYCGHKYYTKNATKCRTHLLQNCPNIDKDIKQSIIDEHMKNVEKNDSCYLSPKTNNNNKNTDRVLSSSGVKPKSRVWDHFNEEYDQKGTIVRRCKYCDRAFTAGVNRNATKMRYHLALYCTSIDEPTKQLLIGDNNGVFIRKPVRLPGGVRRHKSSNGGSKVWDCCWPGCDKKFSKHCQMITHHRVHTGERYHCDWPGCEWSGKSKNYLNLHKFTHSGEKPFVCDWPGCDFKSSRPASLRIHKMRHNNELNYRCDWPDCTRVFLTNSQLKVHRLVHSGDRPHACQLCDKRYPTFNKLKVHQNKQHPNQETV